MAQSVDLTPLLSTHQQVTVMNSGCMDKRGIRTYDSQVRSQLRPLHQFAGVPIQLIIINVNHYNWLLSIILIITRPTRRGVHLCSLSACALSHVYTCTVWAPVRSHVYTPVQHERLCVVTCMYTPVQHERLCVVTCTHLYSMSASALTRACTHLYSMNACAESRVHTCTAWAPVRCHVHVHTCTAWAPVRCDVHVHTCTAWAPVRSHVHTPVQHERLCIGTRNVLPSDDNTIFIYFFLIHCSQSHYKTYVQTKNM